jgi:exopolysaccharide biosynthesis protein
MYINKRKKYIAVFIAIILVTLPLGTINAGAETNIISETSSKQTVTQGVTLENIVRFTTNGWLNINVLRVDLSNPYIKVDTLTNPESIGKLASTKSLAELKGAVAAVNGSFFTPDGSSLGHPGGTIVQSSDLLCASSDYNKYSDSMASFAISNLNEAFLNYWKTDISLTAPNGTSIPVAQYNKPNGSKYTNFSIFDKKWGPTSIGVSAEMPDIVQMVVEQDKVTQILVSQPAVQIPQNGYVVVTRDSGGKTLLAGFKPGDAVGLNIVTNPEWKNVKMSVTGSSILIKDGKIPESFSFNASDISKNSPKTAIGSSNDGKQLIFVTVDGRQNSSIGLSQTEMAQFMLGIGAYNALNMDGGGSTTMVARQTGKTAVEVMNSPSDGLARKVATAIGIISIAPPSTLAGLIIDTEDSNMFLNTSRAFTVRGYDKFFNPIEVKPESIKWSISGVKGTFKGNVFYPTTYGSGKITAKAGNISTTLPVSVLSAPAKLLLSSKSIRLPLGTEKAFTVTGVNKLGYSAAIDPVDIKWAVTGNVGEFIGTSFIAEARGSGYIDASSGKTHAYCTVSVSADNTTLKDPFETINGSFLSYPETVQGAYQISQEQIHSGNASGKLTYDFTNTEGTRAAYMVFPNNGLPLEADVSKIGLWVYNDHENSNWLRAEIYDSKGRKQAVDMAKNLDWTGWKYIETSLEDIETPAKLTRLYLVQINPVADSGSVYLDDLTVTNSGYPPVDLSKLPKDTVPVDDSNIAVSFSKATTTSFRFGVFGQSHDPKNPLEKLLMTKFAQKIDSATIDAAIITGDGSHAAVAKLIKKKKVLATNTVDIGSTKDTDYKYSYTDIKNSRFFKMDIRKNGLRLSDQAQWQKFLNDLNSYKGSNVFILMENSPEKFSDKLELNFFKDTLTKYKQKSGKNVWVFFKGDKNESYMDKGIRYISTAGYDVAGIAPNKTDLATYVLVTVKGTTVTYAYRPII